MIASMINQRWPITLTPDRHQFHRIHPAWEGERLISCAEKIRPGHVVYDIGAECGDFSALYRQWVGDLGAIVAVEPQPQYWPSIRATWVANRFRDLPWCYSGFLSDVTDLDPPGDTMADARILGLDGWPQSSHWPVAPDFGFRHLCQQADSTPQITLDDLVARTRMKPDAVVMDIEGAEYRALCGATKTLTEHRPLMWVSIHPLPLAEWYGKAPVDIHLLMRDHGYRGDFLGLSTEELWLYTPL